jgi:ribosome-associated translation inhibitor RaiA
MEIIIRSRGVDLSEEFHAYARRRLRFALDRHEGLIQRVVVTITDQNGPRGGADKTCVVAAHVAGAGRVMIEERGYAAAACIDRGAQRLSYRLARLLGRMRAPSAESPRLPAVAG